MVLNSAVLEIDNTKVGSQRFYLAQTILKAMITFLANSDVKAMLAEASK